MISSPYLTMINPLWTSELRGVIETVTPVSESAVAITIRTNGAWTGHEAGQFVTVGVEVNGVRHHRCYSLTSVPRPASRSDRSRNDRASRRLEIAVQRVEDGLVSAHLTSAAKPGDLLFLSEAAGDFTLPAGLRGTAPTQLLFVSGGSGITPLMGMIRTLAERSERPGRGHAASVRLVHYAPTPERTMFRDELTTLAARHDWLDVEIVHTRVPGNDAALTHLTHLDAESLERHCPDWRGREAYICGPIGLIEFATNHWAEHHLLDRLHVERFTSALTTRPQQSAVDDGPGAATFTRSSIVTESASPDRTLLEVAEDAGVLAPFGCRQGVCHTCSTKLLSGCTRDVRTGQLSEPGTHVQLCISTAVGDVALDL